MHRNKTWSLSFSETRTQRNRLLPVAGKTKTVDTFIFSPDSQIYAVGSPITIVTPVFTVTGNLDPVNFKWVITSGILPRNVRIRFQKNSDTPVIVAAGITSPMSFSSGDTFTVSIEPTTIGFFSIQLQNVTDDNAVCSNTVSLVIL